METAITESFMKSVQIAVEECMEKVKEESRKFAAALGAVRHLPSAQPVPTTPVPSIPVPDTTHLEHRLSALELTYQRQVQKTIAGLSEDIGDIDGRLARLEREQREEAPAPWSWPGPSRTNEVVVDDKSTVLDFGLGDMLVNVHHVEEEDVDMLPCVSAPVSAPVIVEVTKPLPVEAPKKEKPEEKEEKAEEEEEEGIELEDFEHEGETYYKDGDNNVYKANDAGEVDVETPIGRWLEKRKSIKFYD